MWEIEFNTFTILARCPLTGALGVATATGEMAVGSRVPFVRSRIGAVATQALTNPGLGSFGLRLLEFGYPAAKVLGELAASDPHVESRQLAVIDAQGRAAARTGAQNRDWKGHHIGAGYVAMGNLLAGKRVVTAMAKAFETSQAKDLWERLTRALEAGRDAGGQPDGQLSAAIRVAGDEVFPVVDLRVDEHAEPVGELRRLMDLYAPRIPYYRARANDPSVGRFDDWAARQGLVRRPPRSQASLRRK
ncbi:MAG: DUF1028 domain-containing protein [Alphaproteobacteria bacterium]|nr:DUF1028 domain-containing protein [Alphaproteobacteria bacterium]